MASTALKRTSLRLGMIPADGIGKEVLPVRCDGGVFDTCLGLAVVVVRMG